jgi:hypothetical protein
MTKEQVENLQDAKAAAEKEAAGTDARERSTIQFPYNDLDDAVDLAKAIYSNAGGDCALDQLAGYLGQPITSGTFRLRVSNAATFGLTENERGEVRLTDLGRRIADPAQEAGARVDAFLSVPLYERIHDNYKGFTLPGPGALEKFMRDVGVSSKQTGKARHAFTRSAKQAGLFAHGEDRLVRPSTSGPGTKPIEHPKEPEHKNGLGGGGGKDPLIAALIQKLPPSGTDWSADDRVMWLQMISMAFQMTYGQKEQIEIKKSGLGPMPDHLRNRQSRRVAESLASTSSEDDEAAN